MIKVTLEFEGIIELLQFFEYRKGPAEEPGAKALDKALDKAIDAAVVLPAAALQEKAPTSAPPSAQVAQALGKKAPKAPKPPKEKKPKPAEPSERVAKAIDAPLAPVEPAKLEAPAAPAIQGKGLLYEETKQALMNHAVKHGKDAALALLKKYGAEKISEVPEDKRNALIVDCEA
jgi:hypothetical protein